MYFLEFGKQHIEFVALVYIEHLKKRVDPKMVKKLFRCLCIAFAITNMCALKMIFNCCDIFELLPIQTPKLCKGNRPDFPKQIEQVSKFSQIEHHDDMIALNCSFIDNLESYRRLLSQVNDDDFCYCVDGMKKLYYIFHFLNSVMIINDENTHSFQIFDLPHQLNWHMHKKCFNVFETILEIDNLTTMILNVYSSVDLNKCEYFGFNGMTQLTALHINLNKPSYSDSANLTNYAFDATFLRNMKNLTELKLNCASDEFEVHLPKEIFLGLHSLSTISLEECKFNNITAEHFEHLTNLSVLNLSYVQFDNFDWLRYKCCICFLNYVKLIFKNNKLCDKKK